MNQPKEFHNEEFHPTQVGKIRILTKDDDGNWTFATVLSCDQGLFTVHFKECERKLELNEDNCKIIDDFMDSNLEVVDECGDDEGNEL